MSKRSDTLLLEDMLDSALKIRRYTIGIDVNAFMEDEKTIDAVVRNFEIIGEAANRINTGFRAEHQEIEWNRIRGLRNRIVHDYFGIDYEIVWAIAESYLPELIERLEVLLIDSKSQ